ncbi:hypothetical protein QH494_16570 [Sphingomonas sp. AR_OL41]|uniref:hypothetical protein n=1 Tax=Sphingomonas sp. AR_OL41 TaxID=3042729 RepID=UPI0024811098|nr:hypothetical protein [Sphingomonas sp. AR_OL41]MDH7973806.1 hypothetical protein [Sphingomonas sp. AR_OL41]
MSKRTAAKRKGRAGGAAMMVWMFFANLFDPKQVAAIEHIGTQRRIGPDALRIAATSAAPASETESR